MMVDLEHYIITVDSHWLVGNTVSLAPHPCLDPGPVCALGSQHSGVRFADKAPGRQSAGPDQTELEVQALPLIRGDERCHQASASSQPEESSCSVFFPTASTLQNSRVQVLPHSSSTKHSPI